MAKTTSVRMGRLLEGDDLLQLALLGERRERAEVSEQHGDRLRARPGGGRRPVSDRARHLLREVACQAGLALRAADDLLLALLDGCGHLAHGAPELGELVAGAQSASSIELTPPERARQLDQRADGAGRAATEPRPRREGDEPDGDRRGQERASRGRERAERLLLRPPRHERPALGGQRPDRADHGGARGDEVGGQDELAGERRGRSRSGRRRGPPRWSRGGTRSDHRRPPHGGPRRPGSAAPTRRSGRARGPPSATPALPRRGTRPRSRRRPCGRRSELGARRRRGNRSPTRRSGSPSAARRYRDRCPPRRLPRGRWRRRSVRPRRPRRRLRSSASARRRSAGLPARGVQVGALEQKATSRVAASLPEGAARGSRPRRRRQPPASFSARARPRR